MLGNKGPGAYVETVADDTPGKGYLPDEEVCDGILGNTAGMADPPEQEHRAWTVRSMSLVAISLVYAAWDEGVASYPVGGFDTGVVLDTFDTDDERYEPMILLTMGYPVESADEL